jgi:hypothetical protein
MVKKLTKLRDTVSLKIDKKVADALGINQKTNLEMIVVDDMLIIKPKNKQVRAAEKRKTELKKRTNKLMDQYEPVLKKLAKT